jgi:hypothetical protein
MTRKKLGIAVSLLVNIFSASMALYSFLTNDYTLMMAYIIAFTGWTVVLLDEIEKQGYSK